MIARSAALGAAVVVAVMIDMAGCGGSPSSASPSPAPRSPAATGVSARLRVDPVRASAKDAALRPQIDGRAFPDHVLALTWDDGPDVHSLELAEYLSARHIAATFFVVGEWIGDLSSDPGEGHGVYDTGYEHIPILERLVRLGHRLGNHTLNHVLLAGAEGARVDAEVRENERRIDPYLVNELRLFRAPGGAWSANAKRALDRDPSLDGLVGPIRWDVDRKDWESSLACRSDRARAECERTRDGVVRVKPEVTAARYLASIEEARHGIVLMHDRVGDVGSDYALRLARALVPELEARGYVFAAPVLAFTPLAVRSDESLVQPGEELRFTDVDGDGRADACAVTAGEGRCGLSEEIRAGGSRVPRTAFGPERYVARGFAPRDEAATVRTGDVNGDGRVDRCERRGDAIACALAGPRGYLEPSTWAEDPRIAAGPFDLADVNGDGRADLCVVVAGRVACGLAP